jgi:hypothetical protein
MPSQTGPKSRNNAQRIHHCQASGSKGTPIFSWIENPRKLTGGHKLTKSHKRQGAIRIGWLGTTSENLPGKQILGP